MLTNQELERYARHLNIPELGQSGQLALKSASVLIIGAGGLGSASCQYLAAAGVGRLGILDSDKVELSNLQRQIAHGMATLGMAKVDSAKRRIEELNPNVRVEPIQERLSPESDVHFFRDYQLVIDATDNFQTRYLVNEICVRFNKPFIYGAVFQFYGQLSVFDASKGPCFRCVFRELPSEEIIRMNQGVGVCSPLPGIIGTLQALEAIKLITGAGQPSIGRLQLFDGLAMQIQAVSVKRDPSCPVCGEQS
jgi:adenylyltransferase/sulfurtransferase